MSLTIKGSLSWKDVFAYWNENEGEDSHWREYARSKGFSSWREWRMEYATALGLPNKDDWTLYHVDDPLATIPTWHGGPFHSWVGRHYNGQINPTPTFAELAQLGKIQTHSGLQEIMDAFPSPTVLTGLMLADNSIVIIEGMHRCCAVALLAKTKQPLNAEVYIALTMQHEALTAVVGGYEKNKT